ncbi:MAG TPA: beta-hydroxyacyl-ACP dehydratase [Burkholderiales bacterium]|nr:beta-hydroxyacyl-ACP dehydratase [Burkholderiales bacterium]
MLLVERVVAWDAQHAVVAATPKGDAWYSEEGTMPSWIGIELMAQAIAAHVGLVARSHGKPPKAGVLLGTRQYRALEPRFKAGSEILITARLTYRDETGLGAYDSTIALNGAEVATASVNVYEPPDFAAFLKQQVAP